MVRGDRGQGLDAESFQEKRKIMCTLCVPGPLDESMGCSRQWKCANCHGIPCMDSHQEGAWHLPGPQSLRPEIAAELGGQLHPPGGQQERPRSCRPTAPHLGETAETGLFLLGYFSPPLVFFFFSFQVCRKGWFLLKYLVLPSLVVNLMLQKDALDALILCPLCTEPGPCVLQFESRVVM